MDRGLLDLTGDQRIWFLQQTITADVDDLPSGQVRESAFLTPKGKVVSHFYVGVLEDHVYLDIDPPADALADWLTRYRFRTKVDIEDVSGPVAAAIDAGLADPGSIVRHGEAIVFGRALGSRTLQIVHGPSPEGLVPISDDELEQLRIEAGIPRFGVDYTTDHLPQEAGLTRIVPIDKGCYVGQETVARIHFRGHVNKVVRPVRLDGSASVGDELTLDGENIGKITSVAGSSALAMARVEPPAESEIEVNGTRAILGPVPEGTKIKAT